MLVAEKRCNIPRGPLRKTVAQRDQKDGTILRGGDVFLHLVMSSNRFVPNPR